MATELSLAADIFALLATQGWPRPDADIVEFNQAVAHMARMLTLLREHAVLDIRKLADDDAGI
jgi:hypothetical protein